MYLRVPYINRKYWWSLKLIWRFGPEQPKMNNNIDGFEFGSGSRLPQPPNLIDRQYFRLYPLTGCAHKTGDPLPTPRTKLQNLVHAKRSIHKIICTNE